jgi:hypothetical protein
VISKDDKIVKEENWGERRGRKDGKEHLCGELP